MLCLFIISNSCTIVTLTVISTVLSTYFSRSTPRFPHLILSKKGKRVIRTKSLEVING